MTRIRAMFPQDAAGLPDIEALIRESAAASAILDELSAVESRDAAPVLVAELQRRLAAILGRHDT
jgi:hypothetical protein